MLRPPSQELRTAPTLPQPGGGLGTMDDKRTQLGDRRQNKGIPGFPFKDSNGLIIKECRRKTPDRRIGIIEAELLSDALYW